MKKYRFDNSCKKVYGYDDNAKAYVFIGDYEYLGVTKDMSYERAERLMGAWQAEWDNASENDDDEFFGHEEV
jgi:hypothetical protein